MIREAKLEDLDYLVEIENRSFSTDRFSRRNLKYLLTKANATTLVSSENGKIRGYVMVLFNRGTSLARLYSLGVDPEIRGCGIGAKLLNAAEQDALSNDCVTMRLEVRKDNSYAIKLYAENGYRKFDAVPDYYEDHMEALRLEKHLVPHLKPDMVPVPYYQQTVDFTCGPSALIMAMKALDGALEIDRKLELRIWRESTTIFMTSGHGGCGPFGLALSAFYRGFDVEIYVNERGGTLFIDSVRNPEKKEVIRLVQEDQLDEISNLPIKLHYGVLSVEQVEEKFKEGGIPIVLISSYRIYREKYPHWVVVTGFDERYIYVHDSFVDYDQNKTETDSINLPILKKDFERMSKYGKSGQKAVLVIKKKKNGAANADSQTKH